MKVKTNKKIHNSHFTINVIALLLELSRRIISDFKKTV